jgi:hypothetical protein
VPMCFEPAFAGGSLLSGLPCPKAIAFLSEETAPVFIGVGSKRKYGDHAHSRVN